MQLFHVSYLWDAFWIGIAVAFLKFGGRFA